jgi:hypothetical protein
MKSLEEDRNIHWDKMFKFSLVKQTVKEMENSSEMQLLL